MKTYKLARLMLVAIALATAVSGITQDLPTGGYQGGKHGNIQYQKWTGAVDDNWSEPGNWCPAIVPGAQDDVVIPAAASIMPEVKANGLSCKSLTLEPGGTVTIKPGYTLTVNGVETQ